MSTPKKSAVVSKPIPFHAPEPESVSVREPDWVDLLRNVAIAGIRRQLASGHRLSPEQQALLDAAGG
jgi:hypothetical protein